MGGRRGEDVDTSYPVAVGSDCAAEVQHGVSAVGLTTRSIQPEQEAIPTETATLDEDRRYQEAILAGVSRTFALTIPQLPERLRVVVGNAYLLCRIADTIEDSPTLSLDEKRRFCDEFARIVQGDVEPVEFARELSRLLTRGTLEAERDLVAHTPRVVRLTRSFRPEERAALARCVRIMAGGMEEFQEGNFQDGLVDLAHLDAYCYHVAGVVGEMLCELFCAHSEQIARRREDLMRLAVSFGQGLQMTNILKDIWDDKGRGVCWLPRSVFAAHGFDLRELGTRPAHLGYRDGLIELVGIARRHLENALEYTLLIPKEEPGIRRFCLWAIGMAILTLQRIRRNPCFASGDEVKISRRSVRLVMLASNAACRSDSALRGLFAMSAFGLPRAERRGRRGPAEGGQ